MSEIVGSPNYKMMEVLTENDHLKDQLIQLQKETIEALRTEVAYLKSLIKPVVADERDAGSNMIAPPNFKQKPSIKTTSELAAIMEQRSKKKTELPISAEDLNEDSIS